MMENQCRDWEWMSHKSSVFAWACVCLLNVMAWMGYLTFISALFKAILVLWQSHSFRQTIYALRHRSKIGAANKLLSHFDEKKEHIKNCAIVICLPFWSSLINACLSQIEIEKWKFYWTIIISDGIQWSNHNLKWKTYLENYCQFQSVTCTICHRLIIIVAIHRANEMNKCVCARIAL